MSNFPFEKIRALCIDIVEKESSRVPEEFRNQLISQVSHPHDDVVIPADFDIEFKNVATDINAAVASHFLHSGFAAHLNLNQFDDEAVAILVGDALLTLGTLFNLLTSTTRCISN